MQLITRVRLLILLPAIFTSCSPNTNKIITEYELSTNNIVVLDLNKISELTPFYSKDSIAILDTLYYKFYKAKINSLNRQYDDITKRHENAVNELKVIENPLMAEVFRSRITIIKEEKIRIEKILSIYKNSPEQTELNHYTKKSNYYTKNSSAILGYTMTVDFIGKQGYLSKELFFKVYLFNKNRDKIIGLIDYE